jgi:hypothetical protein
VASKKGLYIPNSSRWLGACANQIVKGALGDLSLQVNSTSNLLRLKNKRTLSIQCIYQPLLQI